MNRWQGGLVGSGSRVMIHEISLKYYPDFSYFRKGWHFNITWGDENFPRHFAVGFHETNWFFAICKIRKVE